jgi:hypothetical protein
MDDESSVSSKSECIEALQTLDLRVWLSHHNKNISKQYEHHERSEKQRKVLIQGLSSEENPEKALGTILELAFPRVIKKNGKVANAALSSSACNRAVQSMLHVPTFNERHKSGLHPVTLLTEQRRKIVLNALTDIGYPNEEKKVSEKKLADYIEAKNAPPAPEGPSFTPKLTPLPTPQSHHRHHHHHHHRHQPHHDIHSGELLDHRRFTPKWDHYDTMRTRWGYLQPQVRKLTHEDEAHAPKKSHKYIKVDNKTLIHGNVNDIHHYHAVHEKRSEKFQSVLAKSQKLEADRIEKASQYYIPSPCVRY